MNTAPYFHLVLQPNIGLVSTIRRFTAELYTRVLDKGLASRLALAVHEVLENAIAYSDGTETEFRIDIEGDTVNVRTWNRAAPERIAAIKAGIDHLMASSDPDAYYQEQMNVTSKRTDGSGLGLARVRNEADMALSYEIDEDRVCIRAATKLVGGLRS
jgi:hypothetical protein